ncbi:MAG: hypothetical protein AAGF06_06130 [Pseudomonadota bacterium]
MTDTAHIFTPTDDSLKAKVTAWHNVARSYDNLTKSQALKNDTTWSDRLGTEQELADAQHIIQRSMTQAAASFTQEELQDAQAQGALSNQDIQRIVTAQRKAHSKARTKHTDQSRSR